MTQGDADPTGDSGRGCSRAESPASSGSSLRTGQIVAAFLGGGDNITAGILGIAFCILGYYLDSRKLATVTVFLCVAAILFGMATSQGVL